MRHAAKEYEYTPDDLIELLIARIRHLAPEGRDEADAAILTTLTALGRSLERHLLTTCPSGSRQ